MPLPPGYTLDAPANLPSGYSLDGPDAPNASSVPDAPGPARPPLPAQLASGLIPDSSNRVVDERTGRPIARQQSGFGPPSPLVEGLESIAGAGTRTAAERQSSPGSVPSTGRRIAGGASRAIRAAGESIAPVALPAAAATAGIPAAAAGLITGLAAQQGVEHGAQALGAPPEYSALGGDIAGAAAGLVTGRTVGDLRTVDPHVAALRAWGFEKDPRILDQIKSGDVKLTSGLADLRATGRVQGPYANESVLDALPEAKSTNRAAWQAWMDRARGQARMGTPIIQATAQALKQTINDPRAAAILDEASRQYNRPLTADELYGLLEEKNAELKSFYSGSKEVQAAAERAGADTLKSKPLLEAQARTLRGMLYQMLDPEGQGAGPAEVQGRFGALKAIEEAANARRTDIVSEHHVSPAESIAEFHIDPRKRIAANLKSSEWLIENAVNHAPAAPGLPVPQGMYPMNPRGLPAPAHAMGPITPDSSFVRSSPAMPQPPNPARALPPATTRMAPPAGSAGPHPTTSPAPYVGGGGPSVTPGVSPAPLPDPSGNIARALGRAIADSQSAPVEGQ